MIFAKKNRTEYFKMVSGIDASLVFIREFRHLDPDKDKCFCLRHDVDDAEIEHAVAFAKEEQANGIRATYFINHDRQYFDYSPGFLQSLKQIIAAGHEIAFHNNGMAVAIREKKSFEEVIAKPLAFLRQAGLVVGSSSHGDPLCAAKHFLNHDIWKECADRRKGDLQELGFQEHSLSDFGLEYEAYALPYTAYLSDNGGTWSGSYKIGGNWSVLGRAGSISGFERIGAQGDISIRDNIIQNFNATSSGLFQILIHPQWWDVEQRNFKSEIRSFYDKFYSEGGFGYSAGTGRTFLENNTSLGKIIDQIPNLSCLDVGCGDGFWSNLISRMGYKVTGIDLSRIGIEIAGNKYSPPCSFQVANALNFMPKKPFDVLFVRALSSYNKPVSEDLFQVSHKLLELTKYLLCFSMYSKEPYRQWNEGHSSYYHHPEDIANHFAQFVPRDNIIIKPGSNFVVEVWKSKS